MIKLSYLLFYSSPKSCWIRRSRIRLPWLLSLCCPSCWPSSPSLSSTLVTISLLSLMLAVVSQSLVYLGYYLSAVPHVGCRLPVSRLPWLLSLCCPSCWPSSPSLSSTLVTISLLSLMLAVVSQSLVYFEIFCWKRNSSVYAFIVQASCC